ncbi:hypothetical protein G7B40_014020 [Aetokthonos hydrillicola Thurmond2011]|jgi:hypothetical protein|uniref:Nucleotide-diphospho-sugar transferase domain-containing protein n=1 Tax=Aetokthonos hydrillicola Thurmond2011 TaxID=2712845 RepID=A0AAP5I6E0_9CYAN|nr:hypothetical protein [Aetokthonos hydrillicola]MBW4583631.1 hypothetical protein [Aetokthonos hydrillicola CCALA 1050]MDR9895676.1 hypothetical protein [Aetokthonos hydrillicola Thurmond2011]
MDKSQSFIQIPVIVPFFGGSPNYLKLSLKSAAKFNTNVLLIGDESNKKVWGSYWNSESLKLDKYQDFIKNYQHMSSNSEYFETMCFKRNFVLEEWMKTEDKKQVFLLDCDVVTFADYSKEILPLLPNDCAAALLATKNQDNFRWSSSPHCSYWTLEALEDFTSFCIKAYKSEQIRNKLKDKYQWHIDNNQPGGICEMTLLYLWSEENKTKVFNLASVKNDIVVDNCINESKNYFDDEYEMRFGFKKFIFKNGTPYGYNNLLSKQIKFLSIHCQGHAKQAMRFLCNDGFKNFYSELYNLGQFIKSRLVASNMIQKERGKVIRTRGS